MDTRRGNAEAPIFQAVRQNNTDEVKKLLQINPSDSFSRNGENMTPAHLGRVLEHWPCVEILLQHRKHSITSLNVFKDYICGGKKAADEGCRWQSI